MEKQQTEKRGLNGRTWSSSPQFIAFNSYFYFRIGYPQLTDKKAEDEVKSDGESEQADDQLPFTSISQLYPSFKAPVNKERLILTVSFFKQGIFKQLLTEGERWECSRQIWL